MTGETGGLITFLGAFYPRDCDHMGHVNVAAYGAKFDEANWVFFCRIGLTPSYLSGDRFGMAGVQQNFTYRQEAFAGDVIEISSHLLEFAERRLRVRHDMCSLEKRTLIASCDLTAVHLDKQAHKSCPFPDAIRAAAEAVQAGKA